jgi:hypothetical protein
MIRPLFSLLLVLILALTSQSMAVARGANAATGQIVLCTGAGPVAVYVDATGAPTRTPRICPDSALNILFETEGLVLHAPERLLRFSAPDCVAACQIAGAGIVTPPSRAPPVLI